MAPVACSTHLRPIFESEHLGSHVTFSTFAKNLPKFQVWLDVLRTRCLMPSARLVRIWRKQKLLTAREISRQKNSISLKEARESKYWLRLAEAKSLGDKKRRQRLLKESDEWVAMLTTGVKNLPTRTPSVNFELKVES